MEVVPIGSGVMSLEASAYSPPIGVPNAIITKSVVGMLEFSRMEMPQ